MTPVMAWAVAANLTLWTALFVFLLRLEKRLDREERRQESPTA